MPKHYKIANIPEYLSHEMAIEVQNRLNSGYTLEFKSDFKDGSIWVLSKMVTWDEFNNEVKKEHVRIEEHKTEVSTEEDYIQESLDRMGERIKERTSTEKKWYSSPLFDEFLRATIYVIAGIFFGHILTIL